MDSIALTQYSHGSGCGCKIAPSVLSDILAQLPPQPLPGALLVGRSTNDDAAVYVQDNGQLIITTTDFFTPIVDDPYTFGCIAAANALSDIYAMGGQPLMALAILGWPVDKLPASIAAKVLEGGQSVCQQAGIPMAGGHSIDSPEPFFGLSVTGRADRTHLKTNSGAKAGDLLLLTKPLGTGIVSTAVKRGKATPAHAALISRQMQQLNTIGATLAGYEGVHAMTDVTGFGLIGHLLEMCKAAQLSATLQYDNVPLLPKEVLQPYLEAYTIPDNTYRNFNSYKTSINTLTADQIHLLCDPQTNGGLLLAVAPGQVDTIRAILQKADIHAKVFGAFTAQTQPLITVV